MSDHFPGRSRRRATSPDAGDVSHRGQSLVEFAIILPLFLLIFMGIIQLGLLFSAHIGLINGVREAARYGSLSPTTASNQTGNGSAIENYLSTTVLPTSVIAYSSANLRASSVTYCAYQNPGSGSPATHSVRLTVTARYAHPLFIPMVGAILDGFDGALDGALAITTMEHFRVENLPLNPGEVTGMTTCP
ncbi:MAG: TadE/TadG family type IV pilus assembly protein [Chloroflexota bacterium]